MKRTTEREQFLADIVITAVEGGTGYWAAVSGYRWSDEQPATTRATLHEISDDESGFDGEQYALTIDAVATGLNRLLKGDIAIRDGLRKTYAEASRENDAGYLDADDADLIAQAGLLGEIRYG